MEKGLGVCLPGLPQCSRVSAKMWADAAYRGQELVAWCQAEGGSYLEVVERQPGTRGFSILPRRWGVERTLSLDLSQEEHEQGLRTQGADE
jgi:putative transposase